MFFCCHEKALEYDEYDDLLGHCETQGQKCVTLHPDFQDNMLSESVLKIDVCRYLEENWPLDDEDLERVHKLYRHVAHQRCSRWVIQILGKKNRRPFPACIYAKICERFASPDGLYTHFKYAKTSKRYCLCVSIILCINNTVQISLVMYQICFSIDDTYGSKFHAAHIDMLHTYLFIWKQISIKLTRFNFTCCRDKQASIFKIQGNYMVTIW